MCFSNPNSKIKNIFTRVLKGHIAVSNTNLNKINTGEKIDKRARTFLKKINLDYSHGTGHGVGYFLNVHEGPQSISKFNNIKIRPGMIVSNEPGYYKEKKFGIRIENLIYVKKNKKNIQFKNLTLAPIDIDLINFKMLNSTEKKYIHKIVGFNSRLDALQATILRFKLSVLHKSNQKRRKVALASSCQN